MRIFLDDNHSRCSNNKNVCKPQGGIDASERGQIAFHKGWMAHDVFEAKRAYLTRYEIDVSAPFDGSYAFKKYRAPGRLESPNQGKITSIYLSNESVSSYTGSKLLTSRKQPSQNRYKWPGNQGGRWDNSNTCTKHWLRRRR